MLNGKPSGLDLLLLPGLRPTSPLLGLAQLGIELLEFGLEHLLLPLQDAMNHMAFAED